MIYGPSGTGKTCSVYAIANELGHEVVEVNASDMRNAEQINQKVGNAINQQSLFAVGSKNGDLGCILENQKLHYKNRQQGYRGKYWHHCFFGK